MKKTFILLMLSISLAGMAQTQKDIVNSNVPLVFLGCDYANIRFTKAADFINKPEINRFFVDCNHLILVNLKAMKELKQIVKEIKRLNNSSKICHNDAKISVIVV
jgi:hypothetical protein